MKISKKIIKIICICSLIFSNICTVAMAANNELKVGDYVIVGSYNNSPILWRYSADDDNGKLMVSNYILAIKRYSSPRKDEDYHRSDWSSTNYWSVSTIRAWLNSEADAGSVEWLDDNPPKSYNSMLSTKNGGIVKGIRKGYEYEAGFLNSVNFSTKQMNLFKEVTQWTMLPSEHLDLSENGLKERYWYVKETKIGPGTSHDDGKFIYINYTIPELPNAYYGAAMQTTDEVFLLDEMQLYRIWKNFGDVNATHAPNIIEEDGFVVRNSYMLRSGYTGWDGENYGGQSGYGVRPAFYLNTDAIETMTGSGTLEDPYVLNAGSNSGDAVNTPEAKKLTVTVDNTPLAFDVEPVIENDRVLVPMRKIFETLGADVEWDNDTQTVTATKDNTKINLQIDNTEMQVNDKTVTLDAAPKLLNDRTLVPIRAVSESLNAKVDWNESEQRVVITTGE